MISRTVATDNICLPSCLVDAAAIACGRTVRGTATAGDIGTYGDGEADAGSSDKTE